MKKTILIFVAILLATLYANAQTAFYIKPEVSLKTNSGFFNHNKNVNVIENKYFSFGTDKMFVDNSVNFGINLGVKLKEKHFFELGVSSFSAGLSSDLYHFSEWKDVSTGVNYLISNSSKSTTSSPLLKLSFAYNHLLCENKQKTIQLRGIAGFGVLSGKNSSSIIGPIGKDEISPNVFLEQENTDNSFKRNSPYVNIGIGADFYTKSSKYLFSIDASYLYNFNKMYSEDRIFKITDNGVNTNYRYFLSSTGSGFSITLSRRFQVYPWKWRK